jgi:AcrR family transcriptional regulator
MTRKIPDPKPGSTRRGARRPRRRLDKSAVVRAAADLVNAFGWEALSLGKLAGALGVQPPSLYNHIDSLAGLARELTLLSTRELGERLADAAIGQSGPEAVSSLARAYRQYIKENPGVYLMGVRSAAFQNPPDADLQAAQSRVLGVTLAAMAAFGLSEPDALHAIRGLRSLVHGFATLEIAGGFGLPLDCDESFRRLLEIFIRDVQRR